MTILNLNTNNAVALNTKNIVTMTSQEIADLVESRHDSVKRTVERLAESGVITLPPLVETSFLNSIGRTQHSQVYVFSGDQGKRDTTIIVAQLSPQFTGQLVDRWMELEKQVQQFQLPTTFSEALLLAAKLEEERVQLALEVKQKQLVIEQQQHTVDAYELIAGKRGVLKFQDAYKFFGGMKLKEVKQWMHDKKWLYFDRHGNESVSQPYIVNGYLVIKATAYKPQIKVTYKGIAAMARQLKINLNLEDFE